MRPSDNPAPAPPPDAPCSPAHTTVGAAAWAWSGSGDAAGSRNTVTSSAPLGPLELAPTAQLWGLRAVAWALLLLAVWVLTQVGQRPELALGSFTRMGPGYWPGLLAVALLGVALLLLWRSHRAGWAKAETAAGAAETESAVCAADTESAVCAAEAPNAGQPRAAALTLAAVLGFALLVPVLGVALATWLLALLAARAAANRWPHALLIGSALSLLWLLVFVLGLQVPFQLLPPALAAALHP
ncbi:MAG: hypothetical protein B7Y96_02685 [Comamonadaceae bacterium 32-67-11]|nr:MAG: hypothetical protein B7Y96_02685 [Comamonadaceae bacterium 32-67-11]